MPRRRTPGADHLSSRHALGNIVSDPILEPNLGPAFDQAIEEIKALGVSVSGSPRDALVPYAIVGGRSNFRWWLIPLDNRQIISSSLALFQPTLFTAGLIKRAALTLTAFGMSSAWARPKLYLSPTPTSISEYFGCSGLRFAYFTGTDSPHRKITVQAMDVEGRIRGYAKATTNALVRPLLRHEAETLTRVRLLRLKSALIPEVLFSGEVGATTVLVTDTLKRPSTRSTVTLQPKHIAFLRELAQRTARATSGSGSSHAASLSGRLNSVSDRLPTAWLNRLTDAIRRCGAENPSQLFRSLTHGDFTPWNSFFVDDQLYVFDWEYAQDDMPASNDLFHFLLANPRMRNRSPEAVVETLANRFGDVIGAATKDTARHAVLIYLTNHALRTIERSNEPFDMIEKRDGMLQDAALLDSVLAGH
ncbi:MAG: phosphotransferase [Candidatus Binatia bacterium]